MRSSKGMRPGTGNQNFLFGLIADGIVSLVVVVLWLMLHFEFESLRKMESLLKKILWHNVEGMLDLMKEGEVDEEAFLNLDSSHLKEMG